jgi:radical SAM superfamily enzyme YgiQ (UPF0313 family)
MPHVKTVFGGIHVASSSSAFEENCVDMFVIGPARGVWEKILNGKDRVIYADFGSVKDLPAPARNIYYKNIPRMAERYRKIMLSMLGCPWNCSYCASSSGCVENIYGRKTHKKYFLQRRPLSDIMKEAKELLMYKTLEIEWVDDDIFCGAGVNEWIIEFSRAWKKEIGIPMYVSTTSLSALKVSDRALKALRQNVNCVGLGIQAIRPLSLALLNRSWDSERSMKAAYDRLSSFGYSVNMQCIVGLPVEDPVDDAIDTIKGLQRIGRGSICSCYPLMIYPGTAMEKICAEKGYKMNTLCNGDTNSGITGIAFDDVIVKRLRNICKLGTLFVKHSIGEEWMRALIGADMDDKTSKRLSVLRYRECVRDRLKHTGKKVLNKILQSTNVRY